MSIPDTSPEAAQAGAPFDEQPDGKPKRHRRTKAEIQADLAKAEETKATEWAQLDLSAKLERLAENGEPPPFDARLVDGRVHVTVRRVVNTGKYESCDVMLFGDFARDPRFRLDEIYTMLGDRLLEDVNRLADKIQASVVVEK